MDHFGFVLATKMLMDEKHEVRYMYRELSDNPQDSSWRFFCGDEDKPYVEDPENIGVYDIKTVLALDQSILPYLDSSAGIVLEWNDEQMMFVEVKS